MPVRPATDCRCGWWDGSGGGEDAELAYSLAATYYRTGLLLGLVSGDEVHRWAERVIEAEAVAPDGFVDIVSTPAGDLSGLRISLWPLSHDPEPPEVLRAMYGLLYRELASGRRPLRDTLTVLRQMRSMLRLPPDMYEELNATLVEHAAVDTAIPHWLARFENADRNLLGHS